MVKGPESLGGQPEQPEALDPYPEVDTHKLEELKKKAAEKGQEGIDEVINDLYDEANQAHYGQKGE